MSVDQLPGAVREFADYLEGLLARLDQHTGWAAVFWQRDPDGMRACLDGREVPPWDVVQALLQDLAAGHGTGAAEREAERARPLHAHALAAYDGRPGGRDALGDRLDVMLREQRYAAERQAALGRLLAAATTREESEALRLDLAWAHDDHERATARCAELRHRIERLERTGAQARTPSGGAAGPPVPGRAEPRGADAPAADRPGFRTSDRDGRTGGGVAGDAGPAEAGWSGGGPGPGAGSGGAGDAAAGEGAGPGPSGGAGADRGGAGSPHDAAYARGTAPAPAEASGAGSGATALTEPVVPAEPAVPARAAKQRKRRRGGARFAGAADDGAAAVAVPAEPGAPGPGSGRTPRGARFAGAAEDGGADPGDTAEPVDARAQGEAVEAVRRLVRLRAEGRSGEAHALLAELAYWPAPRVPLLAAELRRAGLGADWATLLWEAASLPADRLVAASDALVGAGRAADGEQILRQGVARPAAEIGEAVRDLAGQGRRREVRALLDAYVRVRTPEEAARSAAPDPRTLVPLLLEAARAVSDERHWDLVHALRVAGFTA
ncbi:MULTISPECIES: hypothetical protein [unclassified Streptomyces]|uniref:hypothetical protein n=1 Tax=unclassified Streptomyces TaxID=2593676 RepID=UPI003D74C675